MSSLPLSLPPAQRCARRLLRTSALGQPTQQRLASSHANTIHRDPRPLNTGSRKSRNPAERQPRSASSSPAVPSPPPSQARPGRLQTQTIPAADGIPGIRAFEVPPSSGTPQESYFVQRTATRNLPVYLETKGGGNLKITRIRKLSGNTQALLQQVAAVLEPAPAWAKVNAVNGHIEIKGWYKTEVERFLLSKGF